MVFRSLRDIVLFLFFTTLAAAWPWPPSLENIDALILRRQVVPTSTNPSSASNTAANSNSATQSSGSSAAASNSDSAAATSGDSAAATTGGSAAATTGASASKSGSSRTSSTKKGSTKTTAIDPRLPPGGVQMVTPNPIAQVTYYKAGEYVTFAWNYTSLSVTPSAVDILASCSLNSYTYTIALNQTITNATQAITWDTSLETGGSNPLLTATYTLIIYDAEKEVTATPSAGYLDTFNQFTFGMYTPQPYTPLNEFKCATCSGALSQTERQALGFMALTGLVTVLTFTWFAHGFGVF